MSLPSVLLHDHLDGGMRASSCLELADSLGYQGLPFDTEQELVSWFDQSESGSLEKYLEAFEQTIALMQHPEALQRVAYEAVIDLAADGVVYAEIRFCPDRHTRAGLDAREVIELVATGLSTGESETGMKFVLIIDALRQFDSSMRMARLAASSRALGVVGFDLAGPEAGNPPTEHLAAFRHARESGLRLTIHAGEAAGSNCVSYIAAAMDVCGAERLGHGHELINDCVVEDGEIVKLGPVARRVRDRQIALEMCPSSSLATSRMEPESHPLGALHRAGFNVTLNTDNRLMSNTAMSAEFDFARKYHGFNVDDLALTTRRSLEAAFCDHATKVELWEGTIAPGYIAEGANVKETWI